MSPVPAHADVRRDELFSRAADRTPRSTPRLRRVGAVVLGWLVLMTVWGFGRAWHGGLAPVELVVGLVAGSVAAAVAWRGVRHRE